MSADSVGVYGAQVKATTPHIDALARQGLYFTHAHVQVANCTPSRNVMWSGRYPHSSGVEGFYQVREPGYPTLSGLLQAAGYFTAIRGKVNGSTPYVPYGWDSILDDRHHLKDTVSYGQSTLRGIEAAQSAGKPFALMINISDPHVPFYGRDRKGNVVADNFRPSRIYGPEDIVVPGFLIDDEVVRLELADYYSSVRRADDAVGEVLDALAESGAAASTLVMFLSDHGMPFPFAKTQLYHHSTWTPLIFRWPGVIAPGSVDRDHMVSSVDILPTLLDALDIPEPAGLQGRSFLPLLKGLRQVGRGRVFKEYNENSSGERAPMRAVQDRRYLYIFNPWSDGERPMASATRRTQTYARMAELAEKDEKLSARLQLLNFRVPEELYDVSADPNNLVNLVENPAYARELQRLQSELAQWMNDTDDPALSAFLHRDDPAFLSHYMAVQQRSSLQRRELNRQRYLREIGALMRAAQEEQSTPASNGAER
ncbi:MAG: sulfatase [Halioglobus sp.]|nr:sulfatase [Halioglobus sp.]